jgi:site-specific DNA recombinase
MTLPVALYCRVSTSEQEHAGTIENQRHALAAWCGRHDLLPAWYEDEGQSGAKPLHERPAGARLLADAHAGLIRQVLVTRLDRLGRSAIGVLHAFDDLEAHGVTVVSITEQIDTSTPIGRLLRTLLAALAEMEREMIRERTMAGKGRSARAGRWWGGKLPYGYATDTAKVLVASDTPAGATAYTEADVVRLVFRLVGEEGHTTTTAAETLNRLGVPCPDVQDGRARNGVTAAGWGHTSIQRLIRRDWYAGEHLYRAGRDGEHRVSVPALVTPAQWAAAGAALDGNRVDAARNRHREYLLRGLVYCGRCGRRMTPETGTVPGTAEEAVWYRCGGRRNAVGGCDVPQMPAAWLDAAVASLCAAIVADPASYLAARHTQDPERAARLAGLTERRERLTREGAAVDAGRSRILDLYRRGVIGQGDVEGQLADVRREAADVARALAEVERELAVAPPSADDVEAIVAALRTVPTGEIEEEHVRVLVSRITVAPLPKVKGIRARPWAAEVETIVGRHALSNAA